MAQDTSQIVVGASGKIMVAPVATAAPATPVAAWPTGWIDLGLANEDGITKTDETNMEVYRVWQMFYPARHMITERNFRIAFVLAQYAKEQVKLAFGGGTLTTTAGPPAHYRYDPPEPDFIDQRALGVEWKDGDKTFRIIVPKGLAVESVESTIARAGPTELPISFEAQGTDGASPWYLLTDSPDFA